MYQNRKNNNSWKTRYSNPRRNNSFQTTSRRRSRFDLSLLVRRSESTETQEVYQAKNTFEDFSMHEGIKKSVRARGYINPTPIQDQAIPPILEGRDVVGIASTGTGKTAAFLLPLLHKIHQKPSTRILIVTPTRELATQIHQECKLFSSGLPVSSTLCIGGVSIYGQRGALRRSPHIVIGTPGRLKDLANQHMLDFSSFNTIVLDEVDRMLDMGFIIDVKFIISQIPTDRQSLFFSATLSPQIQEIMRSFLKNPVIISIKSQEASRNIDQNIVKMNGRMKIEVLYELLDQDGFTKVLVFGRTKHGVEKLAKQLNNKGFKVASLHGNKNQGQRRRALEQFKYNEVSILLATDVASRGLDIEDVTHVINYDLPETYDDYVHRIGRTGRANKKGVALSFVD